MQIKQTILFTLAMGWLAVTPVAALAEVKVAVVDVTRAVLQSETGKAGMAVIQAELKAEEASLQAIQKEATALLEKLKKDTEFMSDQEFSNLLEQIQIQNNEFLAKGQALQRSVEERRQRLISSMGGQVRAAIEALVLSEDYDVILPRNVVVYSGELYDVTLKLTEKLNEQDKKGN